MFRKAVFLNLFVLSGFFVKSQQLKQADWQQRVDYNIKVSLNDSIKELSGYEEIVYYNQSPNTLTEIYFHLWPNAYLNNETPFAKQRVENGSTDFLYAEPQQRGRMDSLYFKVDGQKAPMQFLPNSYEICKIILPKPLLPGSQLTISTSFRVKLPAVFSRMGHENGIFCITQWYPKPAVYDVNGWNVMPYLDQGEFYSEFGRFDVSIMLPKDYVVVATGDVQDPAESEWWLKRTSSTNIKHPSQSKTKTVRFIQDNVHDFAWFASKNFKTAKSEVVLASGKRVDTWLFSENKKENTTISGTQYINEAISFYSDKVGEYPYKHATVVVTPLKAGAGMEYPTITNVADINRDVIVHEVGHNWFYGILGSNERLYPWMDESINNYYEARSKYKKEVVVHTDLFKKDSTGKRNYNINFRGLFSSPFSEYEFLYLTAGRNNIDQKAFLPSDSFTSQNYGKIIYGKASLAFNQLQSYLGDEVFDGMMKSFYEKWKFKHPLPDDFIEHAKKYTNKDLNWFFNGVMNSTAKQDFAVLSIKDTTIGWLVTIKNKGIEAPVQLQTFNQGKLVEEKRLEPFSGIQRVLFTNKEITNVVVDAYEASLDIDRANNFARTKGLLKTLPKLEFKPIINKEKPEYAQVFYSPVLGMNTNNKTMLGAAFYNSLIPRKRTEFIAVPLYAFGTRDLTGYLTVQHRLYLFGLFREIRFGVDASRFGTSGYTDNLPIAIDTLGAVIKGSVFGLRVYEKIAPRIAFVFNQKNPRTDAHREITLRYVLTNEQCYTRSVLKNFDRHYSYLNIGYAQENKVLLNRYSWQVNYQYGNAESQFQKIYAEYNKYISYGEKNKGLRARVFGGVFLQKPETGKDVFANFRLADNNGAYDYLYDESQFGRGAFEIGKQNIFTQQLMPGGSGFRAFIRDYEETDSWMVATNFTSTIPGILPMGIFVDAAVINAQSSSVNANTGQVSTQYESNIYYAAGVSFWFKDIFEVNVPIFVDAKIKEAGKNYNFFQKITFTLRLNRLNPIKQAREQKLL